MLLSVFQNIFGLNHSANTVIKTVSMLHVRHIKVSRNQKHVPLHTFYATSGFGPPDLKENLRHGILLATVASVLLLVGSILTWLGMFIFDFTWYIVQFWLGFVCNIYLSFFLCALFGICLYYSCIDWLGMFNFDLTWYIIYLLIFFGTNYYVYITYACWLVGSLLTWLGI